jgi:hypothetical protein
MLFMQSRTLGDRIMGFPSNIMAAGMPPVSDLLMRFWISCGE